MGGNKKQENKEKNIRYYLLELTCLTSSDFLKFYKICSIEQVNVNINKKNEKKMLASQLDILWIIIFACWYLPEFHNLVHP